MRALRWLLLVPLTFCLWQTLVLWREQLFWFYVLTLYGAGLVVVLVIRLVAPWVRARALRASGNVLLRKVNVTGGWVCDCAALLAGALLLRRGAAFEAVPWLTRGLPLALVVVLGAAASVFAAMELGGVVRRRDGQIATDQGMFVTAMSRAEGYAFVLTVEGRSEWAIARDEWATFDTWVLWLRSNNEERVGGTG